MKKRVKAIIVVAVLLCAALCALVYTRPLTIEQRYPVLDLSQCTQIRGDYYDGTGTRLTQFVIEPEDPHFDGMLELLQSAGFRTRLENLIPFPRGAQTHLAREGDFQWSVMLRFEGVQFPGGDVGSGDMLHIRNFYGKIDLSFDGEQVSCTVKDQEQWLTDVMDIITQYAVPA